MSIDKSQFDVWIEMEHFVWSEENPPPEDEEYCNVIVIFHTGERVGLDVWSEGFWKAQLSAMELDSNGTLIPPDLVVRQLEPNFIRQAVTLLITEEDWLDGRGLPAVIPEWLRDSRLSQGSPVDEA